MGLLRNEWVTWTSNIHLEFLVVCARLLPNAKFMLHLKLFQLLFCTTYTTSGKMVSPINDVAIRFEKNNQHYLVSIPIGVKSNLCLVWNRRVLLRISIIEGCWRGVAMTKRPSWGWDMVPSSAILVWPWRYLSLPWKFRALEEKESYFGVTRIKL